jgi:hypothetical protein
VRERGTHRGERESLLIILMTYDLVAMSVFTEEDCERAELKRESE